MKKNKVLIKKVEFDFNISQKEYDSVVFSFLSRITKYDFDNIFKRIFSRIEFKDYDKDIFIEKIEIDLNELYLSDFQNLSKIIESHIENELISYLNFNTNKIISKSVDDFLDEYFSQKVFPWWFSPNDDFKNIIENKKLDIRDNKKVIELIAKDYNFFKKIFNPFSEDEINVLLKDILGEKFKTYKKILDLKKNIYNIIPDFQAVNSNFKALIFSSIKYAYLYKDYKIINEHVIGSEILSKYSRLDLIIKNYDRYLEFTDYYSELLLNNSEVPKKIHSKTNELDTKKSIKKSSKINEPDTKKSITKSSKSKHKRLPFKFVREKKLKIKEKLFYPINEYFKIFEFYQINLLSKNSKKIFDLDLEKFSKKFKNDKDLFNQLINDTDLFNEFTKNYKSEVEKLISFSALTLYYEEEELVQNFLAKFSDVIKKTEQTFFEFQKKMDFELPDDFVKLLLRHNIIKSFSLDPFFKFSKSNYYYDILFQIISSGDLKNINRLKKPILKNTNDSELAQVISVINKPYPYERIPQLERNSIFFKDLYFHFLKGNELISWSNIEVISEREVIGFIKVLINKKDVDYLKIIFGNNEFLESKLKELINLDSEMFIKLFHLLNDNKINLNNDLYIKSFNKNTVKALFLLEIFKNKLWKLRSNNSINYEFQKLLLEFGIKISVAPKLPSKIIKKSEYFIELAEKSIDDMVFQFFYYARNNDFLKIRKIDILINKVKDFFKSNKVELVYYLENFKSFSQNQLIIYKLFEFNNIVSIFDLKFKNKEDEYFLKYIFDNAYKPTIKNYKKLIHTLIYLNANNQITKIQILHLIFLQKTFTPLHFNKLFKEIIVNKINFSDFNFSDENTLKSYDEIDFKKNQVKLLENINSKENKDFSLSKKSIQNINLYKDSLIKSLKESNFNIFTYYIEFGTFPHDSKIYSLKRLKNFFDAAQSDKLLTVKKYLYSWSKSKSKIDRFLNVIFINSVEKEISVKEFGNLFRLIYPNLFKYIDLLTRTFGQVDLFTEDSLLNFKSRNIYSFNEIQFNLKKSIFKKFLLSWGKYRFIIKDPLEFLAETLFTDIVQVNILEKEDLIFYRIKEIKLGDQDRLVISNFINKINDKIYNINEEKESISHQNLEEIKEGVVIYNAGLLLFWPFLKTLFVKLNLLNSDKKSYKDEASMDKAVLATDFLVNGTNSKEKDFIFNKILCGVEINKEIDIDLLLSDFEIEICKNAIQALLSNWTKIKSVQTLRDWFLNREGRLIEKEDSFVIDIENKPPDIFLKSIPWGISVVNYDLMEKKLIVNWKH